MPGAGRKGRAQPRVFSESFCRYGGRIAALHYDAATPMPPTRWRSVYAQYEQCEADDDTAPPRDPGVSLRDCAVVCLYTILALAIGVLFVIVKASLGMKSL